MSYGQCKYAAQPQETGGSTQQQRLQSQGGSKGASAGVVAELIQDWYERGQKESRLARQPVGSLPCKKVCAVAFAVALTSVRATLRALLRLVGWLVGNSYSVSAANPQLCPAGRLGRQPTRCGR
jgi:hypothetical protein